MYYDLSIKKLKDKSIVKFICYGRLKYFIGKMV